MEAPLALPRSLTIGELPALREQLLGALNARQALALDGGPVVASDTAGLQLLAVLCRDAAARGIAVDWVGVSPELAANAALLGLTEALALPPSLPPKVSASAPQP